jgi:polyisoprenoid-binding protein YceI
MSTFKLDGANHSVVSFAVPYLTGKFRGGFTGLDATLEAGDDGTPQSLEGSADTTNLVVRDENLKGHMLSGDFFDAENAPKLSFQSKDISRSGDSVTVKGELSVRGASQPVELKGTIKGPLVDQFGQTRVGLELQGTIDRSAYGVSWNVDAAEGPALGNDVEVSADLFFVQQ